MTDATPTIERMPDFLNVREFAALLRVSPTTVYRLAEQRAIPFHRLPRGLRFARADIAAYLDRCRVASVDPTQYERAQIS